MPPTTPILETSSVECQTDESLEESWIEERLKSRPNSTATLMTDKSQTSKVVAIGMANPETESLSEMSSPLKTHRCDQLAQWLRCPTARSGV